MGLNGEAAIVGIAELKPERRVKRAPMFTLDQWAELAKLALDDAGIDPSSVNGLVTTGIAESASFVPATVAEYLGIPIDFAEIVDLGGASAVSAVWRAAAAIELGIVDVVLCAIPSFPVPKLPGTPDDNEDVYYGASSPLYGSPQAEFEIPYGNVAQNAPFAMIANRYAATYGYDERALAKIAADQRTNACSYPDAIFYGHPLTIDDVLASPMIAEPLHLLEIVMPVSGGAAVVVASSDVAARSKHRPVRVVGFGERIEFKTATYASDMLRMPIATASRAAFAGAGLSHRDIDMVSLYDCYTITVLMTLEDAGFCPKGAGAAFVNSHDLTFHGDFPCNTHGGQLSFGQAGVAGGMSHVCDATRQIMGRAGAVQLPNCNTAFVSGNGGVASEQAALILQGA